jgi:Arylsulfotransferase (ASST)
MVAGIALLSARAGAAAGLHVVPFPGTPDASPASQIIFSSLTPSDLQSVTVTGSISKSHRGKLVSLPDRAGTAFRPAQPFTAGERVHVTATLSSAEPGTSGDPLARTLRFSFTVAVPPGGASAAKSRAPTSPAGRDDTRSSSVQRFRSAPGLHPPIISAGPNPDTTSGDIFLTVHTPPPMGAMQNGVMILDSRGRLVWFNRIRAYATNLEVQQYRGRPVLTWFEQPSGASNEDVIMSRSYRTVATVHAAEGYRSDLHEFQLTPRGSALIDAYVPVSGDLSSIGGTTGPVMDCVIQELDVRTNQLLWEWHALGHVPLNASRLGAPRSGVPYDFCHLNSIQELPDGNLVVSLRNTWAVYEIDKQTGRVIWTLGGRYSNFRIRTGTNFEWQHDARLNGHTLSLFDDGALPQEERQSSAKLLRLDTRTMSASLLRRYTHDPPVLSGIEGDTQVLANHDVFVGWGNEPEFSEYSAAGKQIFSGSLPGGTNSYRAYRFPWRGRPSTRPSLAVVREANGRARVYASWNGATQVAAWRVLGGPAPGELHSLGHTGRTGFETSIVLRGVPRLVAVQALNHRGRLLRTSAAVETQPPSGSH